MKFMTHWDNLLIVFNIMWTSLASTLLYDYVRDEKRYIIGVVLINIVTVLSNVVAVLTNIGAVLTLVRSLKVFSSYLRTF